MQQPGLNGSIYCKIRMGRTISNSRWLKHLTSEWNKKPIVNLILGHIFNNLVWFRLYFVHILRTWMMIVTWDMNWFQECIHSVSIIDIAQCANSGLQWNGNYKNKKNNEDCWGKLCVSKFNGLENEKVDKEHH